MGQSQSVLGLERDFDTHTHTQSQSVLGLERDFDMLTIENELDKLESQSVLGLERDFDRLLKMEISENLRVAVRLRLGEGF